MKIELAHDSLAKKIYNMAANDDKMLIKISIFIHRRYEHYQENKILLNTNDIQYITPFLDKISIPKDTLLFVQKSQRKASQKSLFMSVLAIVSTILIVLFLGYSVNRALDLHSSKALLQEKLALLEASQKARKEAEQKAAMILSGKQSFSSLDMNDSFLLKQLIIKYDTLAQQQLQTQQQRNIAQSATLSDLAESAFEQKNKKYAIQLLEKSLELNEKNTQALKVLAQISKADLAEFVEGNTQKLIARTRQEMNTGKLKIKDFNAIFHKKNEVLTYSKNGVESLVQRTKKSSYFKKTKKTEKIISQVVQSFHQKTTSIEDYTIHSYSKLTSSFHSSSSSTSTNSIPSSSYPPPAAASPQQLLKNKLIKLKKINDLPCELVNTLAHNWTMLAHNITHEIAFSYKSNTILQFRLTPKENITIPSEITAIILLSANREMIKLIPSKYSQKKKVINFSIALNPDQINWLKRHKVININLLNEKDILLHLPVFIKRQIEFKKTNECFLGNNEN